jgi:preprotein translocase subunit SecA
MLPKSTSFFLPINRSVMTSCVVKHRSFRGRIKEHLTAIDAEIAEKNAAAEALDFNDLLGKDAVYQEVDKLKKDRDKKIEEILEQILPEAFAVVKETARRFKENTELVSTATRYGP